MPQLNIQQGTQEWLDARIGSITASLAAGCLGLCPWTSRQKAWRIIMGREKENENHYMTHGRELEGTARDTYEVQTGILIAPGGFWVHPSKLWLKCSPDGLANSTGLVEIKCPQKPTTALSIAHRIQCLVQLAVTEREYVDYFAWHQDGTFLKRVHRSGLDGLVARLEEFYKNFVLADVQPPRAKRKRLNKPVEKPT